MDATGYEVLGQTYRRLKARDTILAFSHVVPGRLNKEIAEDLMQSGVPPARMFESADRALEYFEEGLLLKLGADRRRQEGWTLERFGAAWGLTEQEQDRLQEYVEARHFESDDFVFLEGDTSRSMYFLCKGDADVSIPVGDGRRRRVATFQEGTVFGEMALLDGAPRAAGIGASGPLDVFELTHEEFLRLGREEPEMALKIHAALGRILGARIRGANALILELDS
jgi:CRP-like cAMP-binding protein